MVIISHLFSLGKKMQIYNKKPAFYSNLTVLAGRIREMI